MLICKFKKIPKFGKNFSNLKYLNISDVEEFDKNCFENLQNLEYLEISFYSNALLVQNIDEDHFKGISSLKYFKLKMKFARLPDLSIKEPIFNKLFKPDQKLSEYTNDSTLMVSFIKITLK